MKFAEFLEKLKEGYTFQQLVEVIDKNSLVECINNHVYEDDDFYEFLNKLDAQINCYDKNYAYIKTLDNKTYQIPYMEVKNRFDEELPNETIFDFDCQVIRQVIKNEKVWIV